MSLNDISLSPQLMAQLYHHSLIEDSAHPMPQKKPVPFLGKNQKQILILVNHKNVPFLPDKELAFLTTVLSACGLDLSHVAIVNWHTTEDKADTLLQQFHPKQILFLDVSPDVIGLSSGVPQYSVQDKDAIRFVAAPSLSEIEKTKQSKSQLWAALKQLFCL